MATERHVATYADPGTLHDPGVLLDRLASQLPREGTVLVVGYGADVADGKARVNAASSIVVKAEATGWKTTPNGVKGLSDAGWIEFKRADGKRIHIGVAPWIRQSRMPLVDLGGDPVDQASALAMYRAAVGVTWRGSPGMTGCALIRHLPRKRVPLWHWSRLPEGGVTGSTELRWVREPTAAERHMPMVYAYDIRAMYLAAASVAELGYSAPRPAGAAPFDPKTAGYWRYRYPDRNTIDGDPRPPVGRRLEPDGSAWAVTPVMEYLVARYGMPEILDTYLCPDDEDWQGRMRPGTGRILRDWSERLRDALMDDLRCPEGGPVRLAVKRTYARSVGMMARYGGVVYRPDWRDTIVGMARVNMLRKIDNAAPVLGLPLRINVDEVWYPGELGDGVRIGRVLGVGPEVGKFKPSDPPELTMAEYLETYE